MVFVYYVSDDIHDHSLALYMLYVIIKYSTYLNIKTEYGSDHFHFKQKMSKNDNMVKISGFLHELMRLVPDACALKC